MRQEVVALEARNPCNTQGCAMREEIAATKAATPPDYAMVDLTKTT